VAAALALWTLPDQDTVSENTFNTWVCDAMPVLEIQVEPLPPVREEDATDNIVTDAICVTISDPISTPTATPIP